MPNYCDYSMRVRGSKKNVKEFYDILNYNGTVDETTGKPRHFYRVFEVNIVEEGILESQILKDKEIKSSWSLASDDVPYQIWVTGYCAWSVYSCMMRGPHTYYNEWSDSDGGTHLIKESERLHLQIEIFSREEGMEFEEYYYINNGDIIKNEEKSIESVWYFPEDKDCHMTLQEFNAKCGTDFTDETEEYNVIFGGYGEEYEKFKYVTDFTKDDIIIDPEYGIGKERTDKNDTGENKVDNEC